MSLRLGLAQINVTVGDIPGNVDIIKTTLANAAQQQVDLLVFPEMCICGYPPEDLLHKPKFLKDNQTALENLSRQTDGVTAIVGLAWGDTEKRSNAAAIIRNGIESVYQKGLLPNYGVFDEKRYFEAGQAPVVFEKNGFYIAITICEDIWDLPWLDRFINGQNHKIDLLVNLSASPFNAGKVQERQNILKQCSRHFNCITAYCNLVGGQDELVFDGRSMIVDPQGEIVLQAKEFEEDLCIVNLKRQSDQIQIVPVTPPRTPSDPLTEIYLALVLGTRDYIRKNGFSKAVIGLSGGIDSALVAAIAVDALGKDNVIGITMPSRFNTSATRGDAEKLAGNLGIRFHTVPIAETLDAFSKTLGQVEGWNEKGLAYENLQARIRGTILMSYSNQYDWLVLTTGNKSETAVGYSTLYGDTAGGFAVIKDVPKTLVYKLSEYINKMANHEVIPKSIITRPPSAELRPDQKDSDSLPDYDILDKILKDYIEQNHSAAEIIDAGYNENTVRRVIKMVDRNEYKRRQSPPGVKITPRAFGKDRRMPITNRYNP